MEKNDRDRDRRWPLCILKGEYFLLLLLVSFFGFGDAYSQTNCDPSVPSFTVDLSSKVDSNWVSTDTTREGLCCGASSPDRCVEFEVTLHPDATGIIFDIHSGAEPPGALFYQVGCSAPTPVGEPLCLTGPGPHLITFCKPGSNENEYSLRSIPPADAGPPVSINDGCSDSLIASGFADSTIRWNSISPGAKGEYNSFMSCDSACDTSVVTPQPGYPDTVLYEVCGDPIGGCDRMPICDTVAVYYNPTIDVSITPDDPAVCEGDSTTPIVANGSGGTPPYTFEWSNGDTGDTTYVTPGTYWVEISDTSDCPPSYDTAVVEEFTSPIETNAGPDQKLCERDLPASLSGSVAFAKGGTWYGGNGTYSPSPDSLDITYDPTPTEISNDSLELYLRTTGNNFCVPDTDTVVLSFLPKPLPSLETTDVSCAGDSDGTATVSLSGNAVDHSFSWNGGPFTKGDSSITGLAPGGHSVSVRDTNGCDSTLNFTIGEPAPLQVAASDSSAVSCAGASDGWASADANGGTTPYSYRWDTSPSQSGDSATGLSAGTYGVEVTDSNACTASDSVRVTEPPELEVGITGQGPVSCKGGSDGMAYASASGGVGGYSYSWNTSPVQNGDTASGLSAGSYIVEVTDPNGCTDKDTVHINEPPAIDVNVVDKGNVSCANDSDGFAIASASGGVGGYSYTWNSSPAQNGDTAKGLPAGTYIVEASDSNGCQASDTVRINQPAPISSSIVGKKDASCDGASDGSAVVDASGGNGNYSFTWSTSPAQNSDSAVGLDSGQYTVIVRDGRRCMDSSKVSISDPEPISVSFQSSDVSCKGGADGSATAKVSGGTSPYSYSWNTSPVQSDSSANGLSSGTYTLTVIDDQGCEHKDSVSIGEPPELLVNTDKADVTCNGFGDGVGAAVPSGGTPPYMYSWRSSPSTDSLLDSLDPNAYQVTVTDSLGCKDSSSFVIDEPAPLQLSYKNDDVSCHGGSDGSIQVNASGGNPSYDHYWRPPLTKKTGDSVKGLSAGTYRVKVSDSLGCSDTLHMKVEEPQPMDLTVSPSDTICVGEFTQVDANATGGNGDYSYVWTPDSMLGPTQNVSPQNSTRYKVTATDSLGCRSPSDSLFLFVRNLKNDTLKAMAETQGVCIGDTAVLSGIYNGETQDPELSWSPTGHNELTPHEHVPDSTTRYVLRASNSCPDTISDTVKVEVNPLPELKADISTGSGCQPLKVDLENENADSGTIYRWDLGNGNSTTGASPTHVYRSDGLFDVSMTAVTAKGCVDSTGIIDQVVVHPKPKADFRPSPSETDMMDPEVRFEDLSTAAMDYFWKFGDGSSDTVASPVHTYEKADNYLVQQIVRNSYGCTDTTTEPILVSPKVSVYIPNAFNPNGNGENDTFYPVMRGIRPKTFEMKIFDRWGELIFESYHPDKHWKGDAKGSGELVKPDVYVYKIKVDDVFGKEHEYVGHVTVVR